MQGDTSGDSEFEPINVQNTVKEHIEGFNKELNDRLEHANGIVAQLTGQLSEIFNAISTLGTEVATKIMDVLPPLHIEENELNNQGKESELEVETKNEKTLDDGSKEVQKIVEGPTSVSPPGNKQEMSGKESIDMDSNTLNEKGSIDMDSNTLNNESNKDSVGNKDNVENKAENADKTQELNNIQGNEEMVEIKTNQLESAAIEKNQELEGRATTDIGPIPQSEENKVDVETKQSLSIEQPQEVQKKESLVDKSEGETKDIPQSISQTTSIENPPNLEPKASEEKKMDEALKGVKKDEPPFKAFFSGGVKANFGSSKAYEGNITPPDPTLKEDPDKGRGR